MNGKNPFQNLILVKEIWNNLHTLCDEIGERYTGTEGEKKTAMYLFKRLKNYSLSNVELQEFPIKTWKPLISSLKVYQDNKHDFKSLNIISTGNAGAEGELLDLTRDLWLYNNKIHGKIVLIDNLTKPPFYDGLPLSIQQKASYCKEKGCKGIIIKNAMNQGKLLKWMSLNRNDFKKVPCCSISFEDGEKLQRLLKGYKRINVFLNTKSVKGNGFSQNVIGEIKGNSDEAIIIGAHYDTVINSVGAIDNASGVTVLLEILRILSGLANENNFQKKLIFVFFGSEEVELQGSEYYINHLQKNKQKNIKLMINLDELGAGRMKGYVLNTSINLKNILNNILTDIGSQYFFHIRHPHQIDTSGDSYPFAARGIETVGLWRWRYEAESPFNRYRHMNFDEGESISHQYRHTEADTLDKLNISDLREYVWEITLLLSIILQNSF